MANITPGVDLFNPLAPPPPQPSRPANWESFAEDLLVGIGAPVNKETKTAVLAWMAGEQPPGSPNATFNPLNIQASWSGLPSGVERNGNGQFNFRNWTEGVRSTAAFLLDNSRYQEAIGVLRSNDAEGFLSAMGRSGWAAGGYGGRLLDLFNSVKSRYATYAGGQIGGANPGDMVGPAGAITTSPLSDASQLGAVESGLGPILPELSGKLKEIMLRTVEIVGGALLLGIGGYMLVRTLSATGPGRIAGNTGGLIGRTLGGAGGLVRAAGSVAS